MEFLLFCRDVVYGLAITVGMDWYVHVLMEYLLAQYAFGSDTEKIKCIRSQQSLWGRITKSYLVPMEKKEPQKFAAWFNVHTVCLIAVIPVDTAIVLSLIMGLPYVDLGLFAAKLILLIVLRLQLRSKPELR